MAFASIQGKNRQLLFFFEAYEYESYDPTAVPLLLTTLCSCSVPGLFLVCSFLLCTTCSFHKLILPYLDRGMIYCIAHVRGGGEMGRYWYEEQGKYLNKRNTFQDFISCAEHLVDNNFTKPELMATEGRSAGGLLMGNIINWRPDLFEAVVAGVPFVDLMNTMCDPTIPLTTGEWEEWGNPNEDKYFDYMLSAAHP